MVSELSPNGFGAKCQLLRKIRVQRPLLCNSDTVSVSRSKFDHSCTKSEQHISYENRNEGKAEDTTLTASDGMLKIGMY